MNEEAAQTLRERLTLKQRELDLIMAIDHVRDTLPEPAAMLVAIANILADQFQAGLSLLCLIDRETGELELKAVNDRREQFSQRSWPCLAHPSPSQTTPCARSTWAWRCRQPTRR